MPQTNEVQAVVGPEPTSPLQAPITLQSPGLVCVGAPGSPWIFTPDGEIVIAALNGDPFRSGVAGLYP